VRLAAMNALEAHARFLLRPLTIAASLTLILVAKAAFADPLPSAMQVVLTAHNAYRAKHCVPALTWSTELAASAQQWANRCQFDHDDQNPHGENLFWGTAGAFSPRSAVAAWYEEIDEHNFSAPELGDQTGHFTQVIWRSTKQLGCGMATCRGSHFWVCRYSPPGNVGGQFARNVPKPCT
jgi:pathogenesis-related protein 1